MTLGEVAGLIAAVAAVALVAFSAVPLLKLGRVLDETRIAVRDLGNHSVPILQELKGTVVATNDELAKLGVTVNCVGPAAATRITGTMPGAPEVIEADDVPDGEWNRMDPSVSSPLVAWLASDESQYVNGQVIRAVAENIILMKGWADGPTLNNKGKRWDAEKLGQQLATDIFFTRAPGLRY